MLPTVRIRQKSCFCLSFADRLRYCAGAMHHAPITQLQAPASHPAYLTWMEDLPIFDIPWLIAGLLALAVLLLGLALYGWRRRRKISSEAKRTESYQMTPEEEMKTLGIVAVRQIEEQPVSPVPRRDDPEDDLVHLPFRSEPPKLDQHAAGIVDDLVEEDRRVEGAGGVPRFSLKRAVAPVGNAERVAVGRHPGTYLDHGSPLWPPSDPEASPDAVAFLLESLWAAMHAQSVALLRFDEQTSSYSVDALVSERVTRQISLFPAGGNVLNLVPDDTSISILEPGAFSALRYHANPMISVGHAAAIAVHGLRERVLLVADVEPGAEKFSRQSLDRFGGYADMLAKLLPKAALEKHIEDVQAKADPEHTPSTLEEPIVGTLADHPEDVSDVIPTPVEAESSAKSTLESAVGSVTEGVGQAHNFVFDVEAAAEEPAPDIKMPTFDPPDGRNGTLRPRNEIIAEEMAAARQVQEPLALALVVPRDAVEVAAKGSRAIAEAEQRLLKRLQGVAGSSRVEPFGELVVGVFCKAGPAFVEAWVERVEHSGPDVQIGVALLRARHRTPEAFRADAETALREAYERKEDCVIVE